MNERIINQFKGFGETFPLWIGAGPFGIEQFNLPPFLMALPGKNELLNEIPSLSHNFVLGKRMERFFSYTIKKSPHLKVVAENLQISRDKITIGEIDFIIEDKDLNELFHIEMVYKFYVYDPIFENETERWIGPNRRDSLLQKIEKLKSQQFPLLYRHETADILKSIIQGNRPIKQQVCFKAHLFLPRDMNTATFPLLNNSCLSGYWIHLHQFNSKEFSEHLFFAPKKQDWPCHPQDSKKWYSYTVTYNKVLELHGVKISPLIWMQNTKGEFERFFVVWW